MSAPELVVVELRDVLRHAGCIAAQIGPDMVMATIPEALSPDQERREITIYVRTWAAARDVEAELIDD